MREHTVIARRGHGLAVGELPRVAVMATPLAQAAVGETALQHTGARAVVAHTPHSPRRAFGAPRRHRTSTTLWGVLKASDPPPKS